MGRVDDRHDLLERYAVAAAEADVAFGDGRLYVERLVEHARHVEVQILADAHGNVVHLGDRDCSVQRRYQKMIEEAPASALSERMRDQLADAAIAVAQRLDYRNAGTVEFLIDLDRDEFSFLEVNTRVQVEHPVTEMVSGIDIVREQLRIAAGERLSFAQSDVNLIGHAIECRINAESPRHEFTPSPGVIETWRIPGHSYVRVDTHVDDGYEIPPFYDSLIAKLIVCGANRSQAIDRLQDALGDFVVEGVDTTIGLHQRIVEDGDFRDDAITTGWLEEVLLPRLARETSVP